MNAPVEILTSAAESRLGIIDCDIHPYPKAGALNAYLPQRWRDHLFAYGKFNCGPYADRGTYPAFLAQYLAARFMATGWAGRQDRMLISSATNCSIPTTSPMACWKPPTGRQHIAQSGRGSRPLQCDE